MTDFKVGDVVILQSGGVWMTVAEINATTFRQKACSYGGTEPSPFPGLEYESVTGLIRCIWNGHNGHGEMIVPPEALKLRSEGS